MVSSECTVRDFLENSSKCICTKEQVLNGTCKSSIKDIITEDLPFADEMYLARKNAFFKENKLIIFNFCLSILLTGLFVLFSYNSAIVCNIVLSVWFICLYALLSYQYIKYHKFVVIITFGLIACISGVWLFNTKNFFQNWFAFSITEPLEFKLTWNFIFDFAWIMMVMIILYFGMEYLIDKLYKNNKKFKKMDEKMTMDNPPQNDIYSLRRNLTPRKTILYIGYITSLAYCEEMIFRYLIYELLFNWNINMYLAILIVAIAFGLSHLPNGGTTYAFVSFVMGLILAYVYIQWGVAGAWIIHAFWNFL